MRELNFFFFYILHFVCGRINIICIRLSGETLSLVDITSRHCIALTIQRSRLACIYK